MGMDGGTRVDSPGNLLPFGVSVCRASCIAEFLGTAGQAALGNVNDQDVYEHICNYPPDNNGNINSATGDRDKSLFHDSIWPIKHNNSVLPDHLIICSFTMAAAVHPVVPVVAVTLM